MNISTEEIVRRVILHAGEMARDDAYSWPTAKQALVRILSELESRSADDPSLAQLRDFIAEQEREYASLQKRGPSLGKGRNPGRPPRR